ncbi:MAG: phage/plasmid primase, P4 family [Candidatus Bathyarchaeia archaeon]
MTEDEPGDMNEPPFQEFFGEGEKKVEPTEIETPKTAQDVPEFKNCYPRSTFFSDKGDFLPANLSAVMRKHNSIITLRDNEEVYIYNPETGVYEHTVKDSVLKEKVVYYLGCDYLEYRAKLTIDDIKVRTFVNREEFQAPIQFINILNGVLDISKLPPEELLPHNPKYHFTWKLPVVYDSNAVCPKFLKALEQMLPNETSRMQIQEMFGWSLWRDYHLQDVFMLFGEGNNGKDTLLSVLIKLLGEGNYSNVPLQTLCEDKVMLADLYLKMANIMAELPKSKLKDSSIFKSLTGGTSITTRKLYGHPFNFVNFAKLIFGTNEMPESYDKTFAYYRRWVLVPFLVKFNTPGHPKVDKHILEKITTPEEMSGILNWALEGLKRLHEQEEFTGKLSVEDTKARYEQLVSPANAFITENVVETEDIADFIPKDYLMAEIERYCDEKQLLKSVTKRQVAGILKHSFMYVKQGQRTVEDQPRAYVWLYCKFADEERQKRYLDWYADGLKKAEKFVPASYEAEDIS